MAALVSIVEGDGEVQALPVLLRRILASMSVAQVLEIARPIRVRRDRFLRREDEFQRYLALAAAKAGAGGAVLVLLDADDDCPASLGPELAQRVARVLPVDRRSAAVLANREFEAWFIAACVSLDGVRGLQVGSEPIPDPDVPRDAKGWLSERMPGRRYSPVSDQPALAQLMNLQQAAARSRSFRKLLSACALLCR